MPEHKCSCGSTESVFKVCQSPDCSNVCRLSDKRTHCHKKEMRLMCFGCAIKNSKELRESIETALPDGLKALVKHYRASLRTEDTMFFYGKKLG